MGVGSCTGVSLRKNAKNTQTKQWRPGPMGPGPTVGGLVSPGSGVAQFPFLMKFFYIRIFWLFMTILMILLHRWLPLFTTAQPFSPSVLVCIHMVITQRLKCYLYNSVSLVLYKPFFSLSSYSQSIYLKHAGKKKITA